MKEIEDETKKLKAILWFCIRIINIIKMSILIKAIYKFNAISIKTPVRDCLTVGFLCAVFCLSWALCSLSVPDDRNEWSGTLLPGLRSWDGMYAWISFSSFSIQWKWLFKTLFLLIWIVSWLSLWPLLLLVSLVTCKSGLLIFTFTEEATL